MDLFPHHDQYPAGAVDVAGTDQAEIEVEHQNQQDGETEDEAQGGYPVVQAALSEEIEREHQRHADSHDDQLVHHDADPVCPGLQRQFRRRRENRDDRDEHEEQGDHQDHLVSAETVHPVPDRAGGCCVLFVHLTGFLRPP